MIRLLSHAEQVAAHLREELLRGRWQGAMPGVAKLEAELGVNHTTVGQALVLLEDEGLLVSQGDRRRRKIVLPDGAIRAGMRRYLDSLFATTPPTALLIDEPTIFLSVQNELAQRGIFAPKDISLISLDGDPAYKWYRPTVAHVHWDMEPVNRRIIRWAMNVSREKDDRKRVFTNSVFVDGGTIGPVENQTS